MQTFDDIYKLLLKQKAAYNEFCFGEGIYVIKVEKKMFAILSPDPLSLSLKCDPNFALQLRSENPQIKPGYHLNKTHWNTIYFPSGISDANLAFLIEHSYELVFKALPKAIKNKIMEE